MKNRFSFRVAHRWIAAAFLATVLVNVASAAAGGPLWVAYLPLLPLVLLTVSGSVMLIGPLVVRKREARTVSAP